MLALNYKKPNPFYYTRIKARRSGIAVNMQHVKTKLVHRIAPSQTDILSGRKANANPSLKVKIISLGSQSSLICSRIKVLSH